MDIDLLLGVIAAVCFGIAAFMSRANTPALLGYVGLCLVTIALFLV
jgi:hypothetical protein